MRMIGASVTAVLVAVAACSTPPADLSAGARKAQVDEMTSYQRSQPSLPEPAAGDSFGFVEDGAVTLLMNSGLAFAQGRDQCDRKPVERIVTPPRRERKCLKGGLLGCLAYDTSYGETQPPCEKTSLFDASMCIRRANPNLPTISYRYASDCYKTAASPYAAGEIDVYAVSKNSTGDTVQAIGWRAIGNLSLSPTNKSQTIRLTDQPKPGECLALADRDRRVLMVRPGKVGSTSQFFRTPRMQATRVLAGVQAAATQEGQALAKLKTEINAAKDAVLTSTAWRNNSCVVPPTAPLPPAPSGLLSDAAARDNARGYCAFLLMGQLGSPDRVLEAAIAGQEFEYLDQYKLFKRDPATSNCARRSYTYPSAQITRLRGGIEPASEAIRNGTSILESIVVMLEAVTIPKQQQNAEIVGLLNSCTAAASNACTAPRRAWQAEIDHIRAAPQQLAVQCQRDVRRFTEASNQLKDAEQRYATAKAKADAARLTVAPGQITLADATCTLE